MGKNVKNIAGASLVEVMIALVLVGLTLVAIATIFPSLSGQKKSITEMEQAKIIAMEVIDGIQALSRDDDDDYSDLLKQFEDLKIGAVRYDVDVTSGQSASGGINTVDVKVAWEKSGKNLSVTMTGVIK